MVEINKLNIGIIRFSECMRNDSDVLSALFKHFKPLEFKLDLMTGTYYMLCESEYFLDRKEGERIMNYDIVVKQIDGELFIDDVKPY